MLSNRQLFARYLAQTSDFPMSLEIEKARGVYMYDTAGKKYLDLISGISVSSLGHLHPKVVAAIKEQLNNYMHLMVYGEFVEVPQVKLAQLIAGNLPAGLDNVFLVNSGSEAVEGALKLAKRFTGRPEIVHFTNSYHGSSHGALSIAGKEFFKSAFRPLLPAIREIKYNDESQLQQISGSTACVIIEPVQGEAGIQVPDVKFMKALRQKCYETGTLLIMDEIQTGFGRTGKLFAFEHYNIVPDILLLAKAMGGGMPLGAFIASKKIMQVLKENPVLGHISTFGGHPVSCVASYTTLQTLLEEKLIEGVQEKHELFMKLLDKGNFIEVRGKGLMLAIELESFERVQNAIKKLLDRGIVTDWFLFCDKAIRIAPPLIITHQEIKTACSIINEVLKST